ncbi:MAG: zinc-binding alcohol dehydrogenase [Candidatus Handelsmanbacteria bacterium]|nr:zinc-binding alcohol dehydrogenase [Candidatus Handelsmanbacteria bacterium]
MPRELIAPARQQVAFREYEAPPLQPGQVRVKSLFGAAKHGTEMAMYKGYASPRGGYDSEYRVFIPQREMISYPVLLGNMCVGEVVELGPRVSRLKAGDRVFSFGPLRQEHVWAETARVLPQEVPWQSAVCLDPADFALGAVRDGHVRLGDAVAVFGMGAIGLIAMQLAKLAGAYPVIAVDPLHLRRQTAQSCGADLVLDPSSCDAGLEIKKATAKRGADVCIEYSGHHLALQAALRGVAYHGTVVAGAWPGAYPAGLDLGAEAHFNRPRIVFSRACSEPNPDHPNWNEGRLFEVAWRLLCEGRLHCEAVVQPVVPFADLLAEYPKIATHPGENIKLGVRF